MVQNVGVAVLYNRLVLRWVGSLLLGFLVAVGAEGQELRIRNVEIHTLQVFDPSLPQYRHTVFRIANKLHARTRVSFLRRELLFHEGELLDEELLRESERNLRAYSFLTDVSIRAVRVDDKHVDVLVNTEDQWSTNVLLSLGKSKGAQDFDLGIHEQNFLGRGKDLQLRYEKNNEREGVIAAYSDPRFLGTWMRMTLHLGDTSDGYRVSFGMEQPFFAQSSRWSYVLQSDVLQRAEHLYSDGVDAAMLPYRQQAARASLQHAWGGAYRKIRAGVAASYDAIQYASEPVILDPDAASDPAVADNLDPSGKELWNVGAIFEQDSQRYVKLTYLDKFGRGEDLPVGSIFRANLFHSIDREGADYSSVFLSTGFALRRSDSAYLTTNGEFTIRRQAGEWNNTIASFGLRYYHQASGIPVLPARNLRQTLAVHLGATLTSDVDAPFQLTLGESDGLRGYGYKEFAGQNRILLNLEDRIFTPWENSLLGSAVVPFFDAGCIWDGTQRNWGASGGVGLRLGIKKYGNTQVVRIDFAVPLVNSSGHGMSVSVSSGQIFKVR